MENHPIPQDVTSFQFKLIGNMTVKQFAYLASGAIIAWIFFSLPIFFLIKFFLSLFSFVFGFALAFLPIEGRSFDLMISLFIKSLFTPNQYLFQKVGGQVLKDVPVTKITMQKPAQAQISQEEKLQAFLKTVPQAPKNQLDQKEMAFLNSISAMTQGQPQIIQTQNQPQVVQTGPTSQPRIQPAGPQIVSMHEEKEEEKKEELKKVKPPQDEQKTQESLEKKEEVLQEELEEAKKEEAQNGPDIQETHQKAIELQNQLNEILIQRERLEKEVLSLRGKLEDQKTQIFTPSDEPLEETPNIRKIPQDMGKKIGLPIAPDVANLIMGIVKDPRGNILPGILVEIKDKDGNPVRAFKTNALGQFASATPLSNGIYTLWLDDPAGKNKFETIELEMTDQIVPAIEIVSIDAREELRKALFTN